MEDTTFKITGLEIRFIDANNGKAMKLKLGKELQKIFLSVILNTNKGEYDYEEIEDYE